MFVSKDLIPISEGPNTIYIRAKFGFAARNRIMDAALRVSDLDIARLQEGDGAGASMSMVLGQVNTMLMREGIAKWEGPAFEGVRCTPVNIDDLEHDDPLVVKVLEELSNRMNEKKSQESESDG